MLKNKHPVPNHRTASNHTKQAGDTRRKHRIDHREIEGKIPETASACLLYGAGFLLVLKLLSEVRVSACGSVRPRDLSDARFRETVSTYLLNIPFPNGAANQP